MNREMLELENIHKSFSHHGTMIHVLKGVDLSVSSGDSLAVMGASGVGKSTLLNIMGSLESPTKGAVRFGSVNVYEMEQAALSRLRSREIGFVFQFHHLLPEFNALENVMMPSLIARFPAVKAREMAKQVLKRVGLEERLSHRTGELSGGEQQRVAIARALIMNPKLLLADEPTGNLDWQTGEEIADLLLKLKVEEGLAMIIVTHNQRLAKKMSKKVELVGGKIQ